MCVSHDYYKKAKDLDIRLEGGQQDLFGAELSAFGQEGLFGPWARGSFGGFSARRLSCQRNRGDASTAGHLSYNGKRSSKKAKADCRRVLYRACVKETREDFLISHPRRSREGGCLDVSAAAKKRTHPLRGILWPCLLASFCFF